MICKNRLNAINSTLHVHSGQTFSCHAYLLESKLLETFVQNTKTTSVPIRTQYQLNYNAKPLLMHQCASRNKSIGFFLVGCSFIACNADFLVD